MAVTAREIYEMAIDLLDEREDDGSINANNTASYLVKAPNILSKGQNELLNIGEYYSTFEISKYPVNPEVGFMETREHNDDDIVLSTEQPVYAYTFEVSGEATVTISDTTGVIATINVPNTVTSFTRYSGLISPTGKTTITFSGNYYYLVRACGLYGQKYGTTAQIPENKEYQSITMPDDFCSINDVIREELPEGYVRGTDFYWEGKNKFYYRSNLRGLIRIIYTPTPAQITSLDTDLILDERVARTALVDYLVAHLMMADENEYAQYHNEKYMEEKKDLSKPKLAFEGKIQDVIGISLDAG